MRNPLTSHKRKKRGSVLPTAIVLGVLAAVSATWLLGNVIDQQRLNTRRREVTRAYFAAEAGVAQVIHWGNYPDDYDGLGVNSLFYRNLEASDTTALDAFPGLAAALADAGEGGVAIPEDKMSSFFSKYDDQHAVSSILSISLFPQDVSAFPPGMSNPDCLFWIRSIGQTPSGRRRTVESFIAANPLATTEIALPAALISHDTAGIGGSSKVHWGEAWSKNDFTLAGKNDLSYLDNTRSNFDPWARYRCEGQMHFPSNWNSLIGTGEDYSKPLYDVTDSARNYPGDPTVTSDEYSGVDPADNDDDAFQHFLPDGSLPFPDFLSQYSEFKARAMEHGRYYTTDADGNIYKDGVLIEFSEEFGRPDLTGSAPYDLVFIDAPNQTTPTLGTTLPTIRPTSGDAAHKAIKGVFYVCANFDGTLASGAASLYGAEDPNTELHNLPSMYLDGVLYAAGTLEMQGTVGVYGCVIAQRGIGVGGGPNIYYNHRLKDGLELPKGNVGSVFKIVQQRNY